MTRETADNAATGVKAKTLRRHAISWAYKSWRSIPQGIVRNAWRKSGGFAYFQGDEEEEDEVEEAEAMAEDDSDDDDEDTDTEDEEDEEDEDEGEDDDDDEFEKDFEQYLL